MALVSNPRTVVTGAGSGLGRAFSVALAKRGGRILLADINLDTAEETAGLVRSAGGTAAVVRCDVSKKEEVFALPDRMKELFGGTDLVFNNAGVAVGGPVQEIPIADWEWMMGINLWGVIYGCVAFIPGFREQRSGHIVNVASAAGLIVGPLMAPYNVAKAGVIALSETLCGELLDEGIGVSVLCPSFVRTNINKAGRLHGQGSLESGEKMMERAKKTPDDIAEITLRGVDKGALYIVPHEDVLWGWRAKRAAPEAFYKKLMPSAQKQIWAQSEGRGRDVLQAIINAIRNKDA
jgi:NAD(P)-dependent dehydrogenase (short-subunit alcohol dehydrogenase family)